jgi:hypothetical protein
MKGGKLGTFLFCAMLSACHGSSGIPTSCQLSVTDLPEQPFHIDLCREWTSASGQMETRQQNCAAFAGTTDGGATTQTMFSNDPCPRVGIVGGCRDGYGDIAYVDWYYSPEAQSAAQVMTACAQEGGTFVPPP